MLPKNKKSKDMVGHFVRTVRDMRNGAGIFVPKGSIVKITSFGRAFTIKTRPCPLCGASGYISRIVRDDVELINEENSYTDYYKEIIVIEKKHPETYVSYAGYERTLTGYRHIFNCMYYTLFKALKSYTDNGYFIKFLSESEGIAFKKKFIPDEQEENN